MKDDGTGVATSVVVPSADFINYRFDSLDSKLTHFESKLDNLAQSFATKEELINLNREANDKHRAFEQALNNLHKDLADMKAVDNRQQGAIEANRRIVNIGLIIIGIIVTGLTTYLGISHR